MSFLQKFLAPEINGAKSPGFAKFIAWGLGLGAALVIAPVVFMIVKGILGIGLAVAAGWFMIKMAPAFSTWATNLSLKLVRWEARVNPIETRMNVAMERDAQIAQAEKDIKSFNGAIKTYANQVEEVRKRYPEEAPKFEAHLRAMEKLLDRRYTALEKAKLELIGYVSATEKASFIWDMTKASENISNSAAKLSEKDAIHRIKSDEALKSVDASMANSFAELDHALRTEIDDGFENVVQIGDGSNNIPLLVPNKVGQYETQSVRKG